jgi:hypothetical protein
MIIEQLQTWSLGVLDCWRLGVRILRICNGWITLSAALLLGPLKRPSESVWESVRLFPVKKGLFYTTETVYALFIQIPNGVSTPVSNTEGRLQR